MAKSYGSVSDHLIGDDVRYPKSAVDGYQKSTNDAWEYAEKLSKRVTKLDKDIKRIKKASVKLDFVVTEIEKKRNDVFVALGIFVAFFTFISLSVQIFARISDSFSAVLILIALFFSTLCFCFVLIYALSNQKNSSFYLVGIAVCEMMVIIGVYLALDGRPFQPINGSFEFSQELENRFEKLIDERIKLRFP